MAGCSGSGAEGDPDGEETPTPTPPEMPPAIAVDATNVTTSLPFGLTLDGSGAGIVGAVSVTDNVGVIAVEGTSLAVAFYEQQPWPEFGYTLYQGIAVGATRWDVVWAYCDDGGLAYVWHEGVNGPPLDYLAASGTCVDSGVQTSTSVAFPALLIATPPPVSGFTIDGADVVLGNGATGALRADGSWRAFVAFGSVDCTACGGDGWHELHSVAWDEDTGSATFVILYLDFAYPGSVLTAYARSIPDFTDPIGVLDLDASWTVAP